MLSNKIKDSTLETLERRPVSSSALSFFNVTLESKLKSPKTIDPPQRSAHISTSHGSDLSTVDWVVKRQHWSLILFFVSYVYTILCSFFPRLPSDHLGLHQVHQQFSSPLCPACIMPKRREHQASGGARRAVEWLEAVKSHVENSVDVESVREMTTTRMAGDSCMRKTL